MARDTRNDDLLLHALADGELDAATALALEQRMVHEPAVSAAYDEILAVKAAVGRLERPIVSDAFSARIAALASTKPNQPVQTPTSRRSVFELTDWRAMAAALVMTAGVASGLTYYVAVPYESASIEDAVVNGHRRSLLAASPIDVASSDRHTVRPWFDSKLGVAPPTPDLAADGYPLVGGRVDVVAGRAVPTIVYRHGQHLITVVAIPLGTKDRPTQGQSMSTVTGYNLVRWSGNGFRYWVLSDLDAKELETFVAKLRGG